MLQLESELGLSPWDVLHQGLSRHTPLSSGMAGVVVSVVVLALAWRLGALIGIGTVANAVLVGTFIDALTAIGWVDRLSESSLGVRIVVLAVSMVLIGLGSALYLGAWLGAGPRDSLMVVAGERTGQRLGIVRTALELLALAAGFALGGTIGVGTVVFALCVGPALEAGFWGCGDPGLRSRVQARSALSDAAEPTAHSSPGSCGPRACQPGSDPEREPLLECGAFLVGFSRLSPRVCALTGVARFHENSVRSRAFAGLV